MTFSIGIDLGTTNTVVSTARRGNNGNIEVKTEKIDQLSEDGLGLDSSTLLPSVLYVNDGEHYVGKYAKAMKTQSMYNVIWNSKNYIGDKDHNWEIEGKVYSPQLVASYYLRAIKKYLEQKYQDEQDINDVVITVPASFEIQQRLATKEAAILAGFSGNITLISEPTSAMLDFINDQSKLIDEDKVLDLTDYKNILVFDLGGGTCDVAILKIKAAGKQVDVEELAVSPHTLIGGTNFDVYGTEGLISDYNKEHNIKLNEVLSKEQYSLLKGILLSKLEAIKTHFSAKYKTSLDKDNLLEKLKLTVQVPNILNGKAFKKEISIKRYNEYISPLLDEESDFNIFQPIKEAIRNADLKLNDIDYVFCVGGMSQYPAVLEALNNYFNKEPLTYCDSMESVSRGAAVYQYYELDSDNSKNEKETDKKDSLVKVIPKLPNTVYLNVKKGFPIPLIEKNTPAGTPVVLKDIVKVTSNTNVVLELFSGTSIFDPKMKRLNNAILKFPYAVEEDTKITMELLYTRKGILEFKAYLSENKDIQLKVIFENSDLSNEEIKNIAKDYKINDVEGVL